jgi:hypothetical protein
MAQALALMHQQRWRYGVLKLEIRRKFLMTRINANFRSFVLKKKLDARLKAMRFLELKEAKESLAETLQWNL